MKYFIFLLLFSSMSFAVTLEGLVPSTLMGASIPYWVSIPEGKGPWPVVYFLHGRGGNIHQFRDVDGERALAGKPFAVVALTGTFQGHDTYWVNDQSDKKFPWRDVVLKEMIPFIEKEHKLGGTKNMRMIAGISMGSHGAWQLALSSGMFKCVAGHSLVVRSFQSMNEQFPGKFGSLNQYRSRDPLSLLKLHKNRSTLPVERYWVDIGGSDDPMFVARAVLVEDELVRLGVQAKDHVDIGKKDPSGKHDYPYWKKHMPEYVEWYGSCFAL